MNFLCNCKGTFLILLGHVCPFKASSSLAGKRGCLKVPSKIVRAAAGPATYATPGYKETHKK